MYVNEGSPQFIDVEVMLENCPIVLLYGVYLPVALMVFVLHTASYICDSTSKREEEYRCGGTHVGERILFHWISLSQCIHMSRRYASRRYAGGLGPSRIRTRIPTTRQLGQWVSLRKTLRFRVRLQLSQSRCLSLLLAMSGRVFLFLPPRGHEPPPTLRDRLNPNLSLYRHRFPIPRDAKCPDVAYSININSVEHESVTVWLCLKYLELKSLLLIPGYYSLLLILIYY